MALTRAIDCLGTITLTDTQQFVNFENIPQQYQDLQLWIYQKYSTSTAGSTRILLNHNWDNIFYGWAYHAGYGSSTIAATNNQSTGFLDGSGSMGSGTSEIPELKIIDFMNYSSVYGKPVIWRKAMNNQTDYTATTGIIAGTYWKNEPITSINYVHATDASYYGYATGTVVTLYGIRKAS